MGLVDGTSVRWSRKLGGDVLIPIPFYWDIAYMQALLVRPVLRLEPSALLAELWTSYNSVLWFS